MLKRASIVLLLPFVLLSGCGKTDTGDTTSGTEPPTQATTEPPTHTVSASVAAINTLQIFADALDEETEADCEDVKHGLYDGARMSLKDSTGEVVAVTEIHPTELNMDQFENICAWDATFENVPAGGKFYIAEIEGYESSPVAEEDLTKRRLMIDTSED